MKTIVLIAITFITLGLLHPLPAIADEVDRTQDISKSVANLAINVTLYSPKAGVLRFRAPASVFELNDGFVFAVRQATTSLAEADNEIVWGIQPEVSRVIPPRGDKTEIYLSVTDSVTKDLVSRVVITDSNAYREKYGKAAFDLRLKDWLRYSGEGEFSSIWDFLFFIESFDFGPGAVILRREGESMDRAERESLAKGTIESKVKHDTYAGDAVLRIEMELK